MVVSVVVEQLAKREGLCVGRTLDGTSQSMTFTTLTRTDLQSSGLFSLYP